MSVWAFASGVRVESDYRALLSKTQLGFSRAVSDVETEASNNLRSSRSSAVYTRYMASGRARIQTDVPYGLIRQWGGVIRAKNDDYLTFKTRQGNWVRTETSRQKGTMWLSRAGDTFGRYYMSELRKLG